MKKESRRCFLEAQQAVAEIAVEQLVEMLPEDFFENTERLLNGLNGVESVILVTLPPPLQEAVLANKGLWVGISFLKG